MKLPVDLERYLRATDASEVWITSFDFRSARIYSRAEWRKQEELLGKPGPQAATGEILLRRAKGFGHYTTIDNQGRVLLPARLRKEANLENSAVVCTWIKHHVEVQTEEHFNELLHREADTQAMLQSFAELGLG
jgi:DNA-binding transcriptional regulator/RsmH inhibitor MraZ